MIFIKDAIEKKLEHLDEILQHEELIHKVLKDNIGGNYVLKHINRVWEPGGGSTLFIVENKDSLERTFLKVKHKDVFVESRLEESDVLEISSLINEYKINKLVNENYVSHIKFCTQEIDYIFLAQEYIEYSLIEVLENEDIDVILHVWNQIEASVKSLFEKGIVHCDLHEHNIRCRGDFSAVIIDLEEARELVQKCDFYESLDVIGMNEVSSLGENPLADKDGNSTKYNCLRRLREVFLKYIMKKLPELIKECNYDSSNGICTALDHGKSDLIYQSIENEYIQVKGQRDSRDVRLGLLEIVYNNVIKGRNVSYVDIGSNNGNFCRFISKHINGKKNIYGIEGFHKFNVLAKTISFMENLDNITYIDFICGEDDFGKIDLLPDSFMSMCSVYHHIRNKDVFLNQIAKSNISFIFLELAVQPECYDGRTWEEELKKMQEITGFEDVVLLTVSKDYRRPIVLMTREKLERTIADKMISECESYANSFVGY